MEKALAVRLEPGSVLYRDHVKDRHYNWETIRLFRVEFVTPKGGIRATPVREVCHGNGTKSYIPIGAPCWQPYHYLHPIHRVLPVAYKDRRRKQ